MNTFLTSFTSFLTFLTLFTTLFTRDKYKKYLCKVHGMMGDYTNNTPYILTGNNFHTYCHDPRAMYLNSTLRQRKTLSADEKRLCSDLLKVFQGKSRCSNTRYLYRGMISSSPEGLVRTYRQGDMILQFTATTWDENVAVYFARNRLHIDPDATGIVLRIRLVQVQAIDIRNIVMESKRYQQEVVLPPGVVMIVEGDGPYQVKDGIQYFDTVFAQLPEPSYEEFTRELLGE